MGRNNKDYKMKDKNLTLNKKKGKLNKSIAFTLAGMAAIGAGAMAVDNGQEAQAMMKGGASMATRNLATGPKVKMPMTSSAGVGVTASTRMLKGSVGAINTGKVGTHKPMNAVGTSISGSKVVTSRNLGGSKGSINTGNIGNHKPMNATGTNVNGSKTATSRVLNGSTGSINSGKTGSNGTQYQGIPKSANAPTTTLTTNKTTGTTNTTSTNGTLKNSGTQTTPQSSTLTNNKGTQTGTQGKTNTTGKLSEKKQAFEGGSASGLTLKDGAQKQQAFNQTGNKGDKVVTTDGFYRK